MKQLIGAAVLALAFTGAASADDNFPQGGYSYDLSHGNSYSAQKPDYAAKKRYLNRDDIKVQEDPNPSKLKQQLQFFKDISGD